MRDKLADDSAAKTANPDELASPFAHIVVDEEGSDRRRMADAAAPLPVPELHHRGGPRAGQSRVRGVHLHPQQRRPRRPRIHAELRPILETWLAAHSEGTAVVIAAGDADYGPLPATPRVRSLTPELSKGLEFDLMVLIDPKTSGRGIEGAVDRNVAMTRATQQLVILRPTCL